MTGDAVPIVDHARDAALLDPLLAARTHVTIVGAGTVGSNSAVSLARLGIGGLTIHDDDHVAAVNLPSQAYGLRDVGRPKVDALADAIRACSDRVAVTAVSARVDGGEALAPGPVILGVDSMAARRDVLDLSIAHRPEHGLVIDARIGAAQLQVLAFDPGDERALTRWHERYWFTDEQAESLPCGTQAASEVGARCGALVASLVRGWLNGRRLPFVVLDDLDAFVQTVAYARPATP